MCVSHSWNVCVCLFSQSASVTRWEIKGSRVSLFFLPWFSSRLPPPHPPPFALPPLPPPLPHPPPPLLLHPLLASLSPPLPNYSLIFLPARLLNPLCILFLFLGHGCCFLSVRVEVRSACVCVQPRPPLFHSLSLSLPLLSLISMLIRKVTNQYIQWPGLAIDTISIHLPLALHCYTHTHMHTVTRTNIQLEDCLGWGGP